VRIHAEVRAYEQANKTYCDFTDVKASVKEMICHVGLGMVFRSLNYSEIRIVIVDSHVVHKE
jgi:hypothetical protein